MQHQGSASRCVLVVGGGIAGFAMMRALDQHGISAVLVDRLNGPPDAGLGLNLPGNAVRALRDLGVDEKLKGRGVPVRRREYRNARNRLLFAVDEAGVWGAGAGSICVLRGDVLELLRSCISESAVRWGTTVSAVSQTDRKSRPASVMPTPRTMTSLWPRTVSTLAYGAAFRARRAAGGPVV